MSLAHKKLNAALLSALVVVGSAAVFVPNVFAVGIEAIKPTFSVPIPNVSLSKVVMGDGSMSVNWIAEYTVGVYTYLFGAVGFLVAFMIMFGGFQILTAGGDSGKVSAGKNKIKNAVIGTVIAASAFLILNTVNPNLTVLNPLSLSTVKADPLKKVNGYMAANSEASQTMQETAAEILNDSSFTPEQKSAATAATTTSQTDGKFDLPRDCPGRSSSHETSANLMVGGKAVAKLKNYAVDLDETAIAFWLGEQERTGVPAGVIIAQMITEAGNGGKCVAENPTNVSKCGQADYIRYFNFGGIGCTHGQVPTKCGHAAFVPGAFNVKTREPFATDCAQANKGLGSSCLNICNDSGGVPVKYDCGEKCYPQPSHYSQVINGQEIWFKSVQCSRKFNSLSEFLDSHFGFVKFCMPYNDSVYKFAYCIGASSYAGVTGSKATILAQIIERNCLCDPEKDSLGCKRNVELEDKLAKNIIKKRNLNLWAKECETERSNTGGAFAIGKCSKYDADSSIDYAGIVAALKASTGGLLDDGELFPQDDIAAVATSE